MITNSLRYALLLLLLPFVRDILNYRSKEDEKDYRRIKNSITPAQSAIAHVYGFVYPIGLLICGGIALAPYHGTSSVLHFLGDFAIAVTVLSVAVELPLGLLILAGWTTHRINTLSAAKAAHCSPFLVQYTPMLGPALYVVCWVFGS